MTLFAILLALLLDQLRPLPEARVATALTAAGLWLEQRLDAGEARQGAIAWLLAVALPGILLLLVQAALAYWWPLLFLLLALGTLWLTMGFRQFSHHFTLIETALLAGDLPRARAALGRWRGHEGDALAADALTRLSIEQALRASHRQVFAPLFGFVLLGPAGALVYRLSAAFAGQWGGSMPNGEPRPFGHFARRAYALIDWLPARLTAATFAVVGDFEDAIYCWRTQAARWPEASEGIVLAAGAGALGVRLGGDATEELAAGLRPELGLGEDAEPALLRSTVGLLWRALLTVLLVLTLLALASWVG